MTNLFDPDQTRLWLSTLHGGSPGLIHICSTGGWAGETFPTDEPGITAAVDYVRQLDAQGKAGIYTRVTTLNRALNPGERGAEDLSLSLSGFWTDLDIAGPRHKHEVCPADCAKGHKHIVRPLPPNVDEAMRIIAESGLPEPSLWHHSGGGLYSWHLLDEPYIMTPDTIPVIASLSERFQQIVKASAERLGYEYGPVGDLPRVLRIPGTVNRKIEGDPRACSVMENASGATYPLSELTPLLFGIAQPEPQRAPVSAPAAPLPFTQPRLVRDDEDGLSPGDDYNQRTTWDEILIGRLGWTCLGQFGGEVRWLHPNATSDLSATTGRNDGDNLWVFSTNTEFEPQRVYDKFGALTLLEYGGNFSAAAKALRAQGYGSERQQRSRDETAELYALAGTAPTVHGNLAVVHQLHPTAANDTAEGPEDTSDSFLAAQVAADLLINRFRRCAGLGWLRYDGKRWVIVDDTATVEEVRLYLTAQYEEKLAQAGAKLTPGRLKDLLTMLTAAKVRNVTALSSGIEGVRTDAADLDADPDLLNTPSGIVDLRTGQLRAHDPALLMTKITRGSYRPGYTHPDWDKALEALPAPERAWYQVRAGQAVTGHPNPDGILVLLQGGGENGKSLLTTDGVVPALGDYADVASHKLLSQGNEHSEEMASLRGQRFLVSEEMTEGRALNVTAIKRIQDVGEIKARHVYKSNMTFQATHSLFATTNYLPVVNETDHGTWRRLALLVFPYTFKKPAQACRRPEERPGDPRLKGRIKANRGGQYDAIVTWVVEGAMRWYAAPDTALAVTEKVEADTRAWRAEADRVLGFWDDRLAADSATCVLTTDMLEAFNEWLVGNGHKAWPKELFGPRFKGHSETTGNGVEEKRTTKLAGLVRHRIENQFFPLPPIPKQPWVYLGVRFRTDEDLVPEGPGTQPDQQESFPLQTLQTSSELSETHIESQEVSEGSARSARDLESKINGFSQPSRPVGTCQICGQSMTMLTADQTLHPGCG